MLYHGRKKISSAPGLLHHSDRGSQYASADYQTVLKKYGAICSMSRKGNCWDNAPVESFFSTLKEEHVFTMIIGIEPRQDRASLLILNNFTTGSVSILLWGIERQAKWKNLNLQLNGLSTKVGKVHTT